MPYATRCYLRTSLSRYTVYSLRTRGRVETHCRGGGQVEAFRVPVDGHRDRLIGQGDQVGRQPPRLVAEHPRGRLAQPGLDAGVVQRTSGSPVRGDDTQPGRSHGDDGFLEP